MKYTLAVAAILALAITASAAPIPLKENESATVGSFQITGLGYDSQPKTCSTGSVIVWGKKTGAWSSVLPDAPEGTPNPPNSTVYPNAGKGYGSISIEELRALAPGGPGQALDDFSLYVTINEQGNELPVDIGLLEICILDHVTMGELARYTLNDGMPEPPVTVTLLNDIETGQSISDYEFRVVGGLCLTQYAPKDIVWFNLAMSGLSSGQEIWWADNFRFERDEEQPDVPEPVTALLLGSGVAMLLRRRKTRARA